VTRPMPATIDHIKLPIADKKKRQEPERLDRHSQSIKARKHDPLGHLVLVACPHLCLTAATRKTVTSRLHLWEMVEVQIRLIKSGY
jgi:hypothetical protein